MYILGLCSDPALAKVLSIIKNIITMIQIIVPILLIVAGSIEFAKMVMNPDDQKGMKSVVNSFAAAVIVFMLPFVVNLVMNIISTSGEAGVSNKGSTTIFDIGACWTDSENSALEIDSTDEDMNKDKKNNNAKLP